LTAWEGVWAKRKRNVLRVGSAHNFKGALLIGVVSCVLNLRTDEELLSFKKEEGEGVRGVR
jgi:hypothetical protein